MTPDPPPIGVETGPRKPRVGYGVGVGERDEIASNVAVALGMVVPILEGIGVMDGVKVRVETGDFV
jgi:hypothetical protein